MKSGIYLIRNRSDQKLYIGSSANMPGRWREHCQALRRGNHCNAYLQNAWNKFGGDNFTFETLFYCAMIDLIWFEQRAIDVHIKSVGWDALYNIHSKANSPAGIKHSHETRQKLSRAMTGRKHSPETRQLIGESQRGKVISQDVRARTSATLSGRRPSLGAIAKMREKALGRIPSAATRLKMSLAAMGNKRGAWGRRKVNQIGVLAFMVMLLSCGDVSAQQSPQDDPSALAIEKAVDRAILAEKKVELYEEKLLAKDDRINLLNLQIETLKQQKADALEAGRNRRDAGNIDAERLADAKGIIAKQDAEIAKLRNPGFLRSIFDMRTAYGGIFGYGVCKAFQGSSVNLNPFQGNAFTFQSPQEKAQQAMKGFTK